MFAPKHQSTTSRELNEAGQRPRDRQQQRQRPLTRAGLSAIAYAVVLLTAALVVAEAKQPTSAPSKQPPKTGHVHHRDHKHGHKHGRYLGNRNTPDVDAYIRMLGRKSRAKWQHPDAVVRALKLRPSDTIADIGAGGGYFTFRFARRLTKGLVYAVEIEPKMLRHIEKEAKRLGVGNVRSVLSTGNDPRLPVPVRWAFMCNVLHHVDQPAPFLRKLAKRLAPGGRFALLEFKMGKIGVGPPDKMKIPRPRLIALAAQAGLRLEREVKGVVAIQHFLIFRKPGGKTRR